MDILIVSYIILAAVLSVGVLWLIIRMIHRKYFLETLKLRLLLVKLPQRLEKEAKEEPLKEINLTGQLLSGLSSLKIPFSLETAVHNIGEEIHFYLCVPVNSMEFAKKLVQ